MLAIPTSMAISLIKDNIKMFHETKHHTDGKNSGMPYSDVWCAIVSIKFVYKCIQNEKLFNVIKYIYYLYDV